LFFLFVGRDAPLAVNRFENAKWYVRNAGAINYPLKAHVVSFLLNFPNHCHITIKSRDSRKSKAHFFEMKFYDMSLATVPANF